MDEFFFDDGPNASLLKEMDRGTIGTKDKKAFLAELKNSKTKYHPYFKRVGPGLSNLAIELKRHVDQEVLSALLSALPKLTNDRFTDAFVDVRVYPQSCPLEQWGKANHWEGEILDVVVSFVLGIPSTDSLDSMTRMSLLGLFETDHWDPDIKKTSKKLGLHKKLNVDSVVSIINDFYFEDFHPNEFSGMTLEILFDGCTDKNFQQLESQARGPDIQPLRQISTASKPPSLSDISVANAPKQVPILIALIALKLGVPDINPKKLKVTDNLYALMGFDDTLTKSLVSSIMIHFNVIHVIGASKMVTVGNAIEFAQEILSSRSDV